MALLRATQHSGNRHAPDAIHEHLELTPVCRLLRKRAGATLRLLKGPAQQVHRYTQMVDGRWRGRNADAGVGEIRALFPE